MACIAFETAETFSPSVLNRAGSGATGLIQFMPSTAKGLGTTTAALARMSAEEQLFWVEKYFLPYKGKLKTLEDVYMAILWPRAVGKPLDYVVFDASAAPTAYRQNRGLDANSDKKVTKAEATAAVRHKLELGQYYAAEVSAPALDKSLLEPTAAVFVDTTSAAGAAVRPEPVDGANGTPGLLGRLTAWLRGLFL